MVLATCAATLTSSPGYRRESRALETAGMEWSVILAGEG